MNLPLFGHHLATVQVMKEQYKGTCDSCHTHALYLCNWLGDVMSETSLCLRELLHHSWHMRPSDHQGEDPFLHLVVRWGRNDHSVCNSTCFSNQDMLCTLKDESMGTCSVLWQLGYMHASP